MNHSRRSALIAAAVASITALPAVQSNPWTLASGLSTAAVDTLIPGAGGDSLHYDTHAIQAAIDSMAGLGGGVVVLAHGTFLSAPLTLLSNITFQIDSSAVLLASQNFHDYYPPGADTTKPAASLVNFISSNNANNITITGPGAIDGQGQPWWDAENVAKAQGRDTVRPRLIQLTNGVHLSISNITLRNAPMFHLCPNTSDDVAIDRVTILAPSTAPNTDGIDPGKCHHVRITNCTIDNGDDNIAVGASSADSRWPDAASSDIVISHCTFLHGHGVSIGSITIGGVDTMLVDSCTFNGTDNGIRIKSDRGNGGYVRNIAYRNLTMSNVRYPVSVSEYYPNIPAQTDTAQPVTPSSKTPSYSDITIANLTSSNAASNGTAGVIVGLPESRLRNIHLFNVSISASKGMEVRNATVDTTTTSIQAAAGAPYLLEVNGSVTGAIQDGAPERMPLPGAYRLLQNYPNPFNPVTQIQFELPSASGVSLVVYDLLGRNVATLVNGTMGAGVHTEAWDASRCASGIYFARLTVRDSRGRLQFTGVNKLLLVK